MPLGNLTSQFFANVYLNELDLFVKHKLKAEFYIRYVDDFVILHHDKEALEYHREQIHHFLKTIQLNLHPDKSKILQLERGIPFLGYRIFPHHKILRKSNLRKFKRELYERIIGVKDNELTYDSLLDNLHGWLEYARWANTHSLRKMIIGKIRTELMERISDRDFDRWLKAMKRN